MWVELSGSPTVVIVVVRTVVSSRWETALVPQARDALAAEAAERGRIPILCFDITDRD